MVHPPLLKTAPRSTCGVKQGSSRFWTRVVDVAGPETPAPGAGPGAVPSHDGALGPEELRELVEVTRCDVVAVSEVLLRYAEVIGGKPRAN